jgi:hypothetical protein
MGVANLKTRARINFFCAVNYQQTVGLVLPVVMINLVLLSGINYRYSCPIILNPSMVSMGLIS